MHHILLYKHKCKITDDPCTPQDHVLRVANEDAAALVVFAKLLSDLTQGLALEMAQGLALQMTPDWLLSPGHRT